MKLKIRKKDKVMVIAGKDKGKTGEALLRFLEVRLDHIVRRLGFAVSMKTSRQLVNHGHIRVNGRQTDIPSFLVKPGDTVTIDGGLTSRIP